MICSVIGVVFVGWGEGGLTNTNTLACLYLNILYFVLKIESTYICISTGKKVHKSVYYD